MGIYAQFWHCHPAGLVDEFLSGPLDEFDAWLLETNAEFPGDIDASVQPLLRVVRSNGRAALNALNAAEATAVDRLMDTYFGMFCDMKRRDIKQAADQSLLRASHYAKMLDSSNGVAAHSAALELWSFMFSGRAVARDSNVFPYASEDGVYHLSYWCCDEVSLLDEAFAAKSFATEVDPRALAAVKNALASALARRSGLITEIC
uniref:hypothetical protein n=1 Tax=Variovorax sp. GV025 TaxID=3450240 RepID=UPI00105099C6